jgi:CheY-like chemotaxis protein
MQLEQVLLNLARNAQDAMPEGGNLTFITQHLQSQDLSARGVVGLKEGGHVCVLVLDNGVGMSAETLERIYEPFFTTKEAGKGTGLGLASAYGTITQSGGQVHAESKPGKGSSFTVCLPVSPEAEQRFQVDIVREDSDGTAARHVLDLGGDPAATGRRMGRGKETILLVENEPDLRRLWASALIEDGYEVIQSRNSMDAGMLFTNVEIPIHLLVTDLVLQDKSGSELAASVRQYHPEVAVLYVCNSGDLPKAIPEALMPYTAHARKPLTPGMLCMAVRELLDFVSGDSLRLSQKYQKGK